MVYDGKKVLILGYGLSGKACERFLKEKGATVSIYDDYHSEYESASDNVEYDFAVISPAFSLKHRVVAKLSGQGVPILSELDLAYVNCKSKKIVAVSGTNGKTTVCTILYDMLKRVERVHLVGNIGVSFIGEVSKIHRNDIVIVEISSFQLEQSKYFTPMVGALTNVGEDHLDRHVTRENYRAIKLSLPERSGIAILNADDPVQSGYPRGIRYSVKKQADYCIFGREIFSRKGRSAMPERSRGAAFDLDFLCAYSIASTLVGERKEFLKSYSSVCLPPFRNEYVGTLCGADVYNDSKGTNIDATLFAADMIGGDYAIILGGSDKGESYDRLFNGLNDRVKKIYLVGANAGDMYRAASKEDREKCMLCADLDSCIEDFIRNPFPFLLFSPASASFDQYSGYRERGEHFNDILKKHGASFIAKN